MAVLLLCWAGFVTGVVGEWWGGNPVLVENQVSIQKCPSSRCFLKELGEAFGKVTVVQVSNSWEALLLKSRKNLRSLFP